jgi:hypothetical protein
VVNAQADLMIHLLSGKDVRRATPRVMAFANLVFYFESVQLAKVAKVLRGSGISDPQLRASSATAPIQSAVSDSVIDSMFSGSTLVNRSAAML